MLNSYVEKGQILKVVHLVSGDLNGGAARGAYWLHCAQKELGIESTILTDDTSDRYDSSVVCVAPGFFKRAVTVFYRKLFKLPLKFYRKRPDIIFNTGFDGADIINNKAYREADIVHLHWINGLASLNTIRKIDKPVVWTLRDMWPFTGGCHYSMGCTQYETGCGSCPQLASGNKMDLSRYVINRKKSSFPKHMKIVGISNWISDCARKSLVLRGFNVTTISNNINTDVFYPIDKEVARRALNVPENKKIVLVGAQKIQNFYKGFDLLLKAMSVLKDRDDIHVVVFGQNSSQVIENEGTKYTYLGVLNDNISLRLAYSAADVFVAPSRMEAFGKTLAESMACGTPVVAFNATGPKDIIEHKRTGYKAGLLDVDALADGIVWALGLDDKEENEVRNQCRRRAVELFDSRVSARNYIELYSSIISRS